MYQWPTCIYTHRTTCASNQHQIGRLVMLVYKQLNLLCTYKHCEEMHLRHVTFSADARLVGHPHRHLQDATMPIAI